MVAYFAGQLHSYGAVPVTSFISCNAKAAAGNTEDDVGIAVVINVSSRKQT
jgi:hypothetical protein